MGEGEGGGGHPSSNYLALLGHERDPHTLSLVSPQAPSEKGGFQRVQLKIKQPEPSPGGPSSALTF